MSETNPWIPKLVVALDIGSTYSGIAWQWRDDFEQNIRNIEINTNWKTGSASFHKTPTCMLLEKCGKVTIGSLAEKRFYGQLDEKPEETYDNLYFFERFKMVLYHERFEESYNIDDYQGKVLPFIEVMPKFIGALKKLFLEDIFREKQKRNASEDDIRWVLTIPAIWNDAARDFMIKSAALAGVKESRLVLALEPEAAAVHCVYLSSQERQCLGDLGTVGDQFVVADLGGGTVDVTAVEVADNGKLEVLTSANGGPWGGQRVNDAFFEICRNLFPGEHWASVLAKNLKDLHKMESSFEQNKIMIGQDTDPEDEWIGLDIPVKLLNKMTKPEPVQGASNAPDMSDMFNADGTEFKFKRDLVRNLLFKETTSSIAKHLKDVCGKDSLQGVEKLILVGGFAESPFVLEEIKRQLSELNIEVFVPTTPVYAVLKGAVLYGQNPDIFSSRRAPFTYGVACRMPFRNGIDPEEKKIIGEDGAARCDERFDIHVRIDDKVSLDDIQPSRSYNPPEANQQKQTIELYTSTIKDPVYVTDAHCKRIGSLNVDLSGVENAREVSIEVVLVFGGTFLLVTAKDKHSGEAYKAKIEYEKAPKFPA